MLTNFVLPPSVDFLLMWQGKSDCRLSKSALAHHKKVIFVDVIVTLTPSRGLLFWKSLTTPDIPPHTSGSFCAHAENSTAKMTVNKRYDFLIVLFD
jgi:hypothetical protein